MQHRRTVLMQIVAAWAASMLDFKATAMAADRRGGYTDQKTGNKYVKIPQTELTTSRIAYGCARLGNFQKELSTAERLIHTAYDSGVTLFDLADVYALGKSQEVFGQILRRSPGLRNNLVIQSKAGQVLQADWKPGDVIGVDVSHRHVVSSVEGSLKRLRAEHLDILLLHIADLLMEPEEVAQAFDDLSRAGIASLGVVYE